MCLSKTWCIHGTVSGNVFLGPDLILGVGQRVGDGNPDVSGHKCKEFPGEMFCTTVAGLYEGSDGIICLVRIFEEDRVSPKEG